MNRFLHFSTPVICILLISFSFYGFKSELPIKYSSKKTLMLEAENDTSLITKIGLCDYTIQDASLMSSGWTKIFDDDFNGDLSQWHIWQGGSYNDELQLYQARNLEISKSDLLIHAKKETVVGCVRPDNPELSSFSYTSGRIESKKLFSASKKTPKVRIMARIKMPAGYGMWPAFWSYGEKWPTQGEIDIVEMRGQERFNFTTNFFYGRTAGKNVVNSAVGNTVSKVDLTTCYHVYEVIWAKNTLTYLFDGIVVDIKSDKNIPKIFGKSEKIVLNLAVGGLFFPDLKTQKIQTGIMRVDWVKVFTAK